MASAPLPSSMAPSNPQRDELFFSSDHKFALHGEMMMLFLLLSFALFLLSLVLFRVLKWAYSSSWSDSLELGPPQDVADIILKGKSIGESVYMHQPRTIWSHQQEP